MQRARGRAQRYVEERHDDPPVDVAHAVHEVALDGNGKARGALAKLIGADAQMLDEGDALLVFAGMLDVHMTVAPPSTAMAWPVMWREPSEARSTARPFRSSSLPSRLVGVQSRISSPVVPSVAFVMRDGKNPGQMAFTVMP